MTKHPEFDAFKRRAFRQSRATQFWYYVARVKGWFRR